MKIIVAVKQVPNTQAVRINPTTGTMDRTGVPSIMNPDDKHALEAALRLKSALGGAVETIALSMGPPQAETVLREAMAMGADEAVLLCDPAFAGADTLATAYTLAAAVRKIKKYDMILCGHQAIDGDTGQVGPQLAACLNLPQVTHAEAIEFDNGMLTVKSNFKNVLRVVQVAPPVLITVTQLINQPRYKTMNGVLRAFRDKSVRTWDQHALDLNPLRIGINGSPTRVRRVFSPTYESRAVMHNGEPEELAGNLYDLLARRNSYHCGQR